MSKKEVEMLVDILAWLQIFFHDNKNKSAAWLRTANLNLGGAKPMDMILGGRIDRLHRFVKLSIEGEI